MPSLIRSTRFESVHLTASEFFRHLRPDRLFRSTRALACLFAQALSPNHVDNPQFRRSTDAFQSFHRTRRKSKQIKCPPDRPELDSFEEASVMTSPATAIRTEIQELIDLQIRVFGQRRAIDSCRLGRLSLSDRENQVAR